MIKTCVSLAVALAALALAPHAAAASPCIVEPQSHDVGGFSVHTGDHTIPGRSLSIFMIYFYVQPVTIHGAGAQVPYVTTLHAPGVCHDGVGILGAPTLLA